MRLDVTRAQCERTAAVSVDLLTVLEADFRLSVGSEASKRIVRMTEGGR